MRTIFIFAVIVGILFFSGCAYKVPTMASPAVNIYSSYDSQIPGGVVLVIDDGINNVRQEVRPNSYACSAHNFPINLEKSVAVSISQTTSAMFEKVIEQNNLPSADQLNNLDCNGFIFVKMKQFNPTIRFMPGFWTVNALAKCDLVLEISVKDKNGKQLLYTTVGGSSTLDGDGGANCSNGANVLGEVISMSIRDTMERYAERISNSPNIRSCFKSM